MHDVCLYTVSKTPLCEKLVIFLNLCSSIILELSGYFLSNTS